MRRYYSAILFILIVLSAIGCAYKQITVPEVTNSEFAAAYRNDLRTLASDEFQGRKPGTPGGKMTQEYLINSFESMGLEPGNNGSYLQEVKLLLSNVTATGITAVNSEGDSLNMVLNKHMIAKLRGADTRISFVNTKLVFVGFGAESEKFNWDDYADIDVKGKIVIALRHHAGFATKDSSILNDLTVAKYGFFASKYKVAKSHEALGTIVIFDSTLSASKLFWNHWTRVYSKGTNSLSDDNVDSSTHKLEAAINIGMGKQLLALAGYDYDSLVVAAYSPGF